MDTYTSILPILANGVRSKKAKSFVKIFKNACIYKTTELFGEAPCAATWGKLSHGANVIKLRISVLQIFLLILSKDLFSILRKYGENIRFTDIQSFIILTHGGLATST